MRNRTPPAFGHLPFSEGEDFQNKTPSLLKRGQGEFGHGDYLENLSTRCLEIFRIVCSLTAVTVTMRLVDGM